jgi:hypothetical protein
MMVDCNLGISVLAKHMSHFAGENVKFIKIIGYENYFRLVCAWVSERNPCIDKFLKVVEKCKASSFSRPVMIPADVTDVMRREALAQDEVFA